MNSLVLSKLVVLIILSMRCVLIILKKTADPLPIIYCLDNETLVNSEFQFLLISKTDLECVDFGQLLEPIKDRFKNIIFKYNIRKGYNTEASFKISCSETYRENLFSFIISLNCLSSIQINQASILNGFKIWKLFEKIQFDSNLSLTEDLKNEKKPQCPLLAAALEDLKILGLDNDLTSKRRLFDIRSVKREFSDRIILFNNDDGFIIKEYLNTKNSADSQTQTENPTVPRGPVNHLKKISATVYWDFENVPIKGGFDARSYIQRLNEFLINSGFLVEQIYAIGNWDRAGSKLFAIADQVIGIDVNNFSKQSADKEIIKRIDSQTSKKLMPGEQHTIILISGDSDFIDSFN